MSRSDAIPDDASPTAAVNDAHPPEPGHHPRRPRRRGRLAVIVALSILVMAASLWLFGTEDGRAYLERDRLRALGETVRTEMQERPILTAGLFILAYVACALLLLPVWWLQMLAGFAFGLAGGLAWAMAGSTAGAVVTTLVSRWLGEDWVRNRHGRHASKIERIVGRAGRHGLLVVVICRLCYVVPYGVSNYLFGLMKLKLRDVAVGTLVGGLPVYAGWVAAGARPDWLRRWEFWTIVVGGNLVLLAPLVWKSLKKPHGTVPAPHGFPVGHAPADRG